jgi:ribosomal protein L16 Arg81 hydroxylase
MTISDGTIRFAGLVAPLPPELFLQDIWPGTLHVTHDSGPALRALIDQPELQDIQAFCTIPNGGGRYVNYTRGEILRIASNVDADEAVLQYHAGNTIQILDLKTQEIGHWNRLLDSVLNLIPGTSLVNGFASLPGPGLPWHWDAQAVFIVQVRGRKRWHLAPNESVNWPTLNGMPIDQPPRDLAMQLNDPSAPIRAPETWQEIEMRPGSVMFMPRGYWHRVADNVDASLHLVLQVRMPNWRDLFRFMFDNLPELYAPEWRRPTAALSPLQLATQAPQEFAERIATLQSLAQPHNLVELAHRFSMLVEGGSLYADVAPERRH